MARLTGFWFQWARGRAIVRKNAMKRARYLKRCLEKGMIPDAYGEKVSTWDELANVQRESIQRQIGYAVQRARRANADWRRYRAYWQDELAGLR